jgi:hypothetical protein
MADARVTTTTAAPHIPELWGNTILGKIAGTLILGNIVNRNFANAPGNVGDIVNVPVRGAITSALKTSGAALEAQAPSDTSIQVTLDKHRYASFAVPSEVDATANTDTMEGYLTDAAVVIAEDMEIDGLTVAYTGFTTNAVGAAGTDFSEANLIACREKMSIAKVPQSAPRYMFLYPTAVSTALGIARLTEADKLGIPEGPIRDGAIGKAHGFTMIESQYVIVTAGTPADVHNVALAPDAMTLAIRPMKAPRSPNVMSAVAQGTPETPTADLGIRIWMAWDTTYGADRATAEVLYGWKVIREAFGVHYHT